MESHNHFPAVVGLHSRKYVSVRHHSPFRLPRDANYRQVKCTLLRSYKGPSGITIILQFTHDNGGYDGTHGNRRRGEL